MTIVIVIVIFRFLQQPKSEIVGTRVHTAGVSQNKMNEWDWGKNRVQFKIQNGQVGRQSDDMGR